MQESALGRPPITNGRVVYKTKQLSVEAFKMTTVLVTGATGYIAQHIVQELINQNYKVVGTVRTAAKGDQLVKDFGSKFSYEIVGDIGAPGAFDKAVENHPEAEVLIHTASPATPKVENPERDIIIPAIEGTKSAIQSAILHGKNIKHFVLTSSVVAMANVFAQPSTKVTEESWSPITWDVAKTDGVKAYSGSKKFAEQAAWELINKGQHKFTFTTVNPVYVVGPQAFDRNAKGEVNVSAEVITSLLRLKPTDEIPAKIFPFIDVRDVAKAHVAAFANPKAHGKRLLLEAGLVSSQYAINLVHKHFPQLDLPVGDPDSGKFLGHGFLDSSVTREILGINYRDFEESIVDNTKQFIANN